MKKIFLIFTILFFLPVGLSAQEAKRYGKKYVTLYMGIPHQEILSYLPPGSEFVGDFRDVVEGSIDRETKTLRFIPKKVGLRTLTVLDRKGNKVFEYRIDVRKTQLTKVVREVRGLLSDIEGITIKIVNDKVVIDGKVLLPKDLNRIYGVIEQFDGQVASLVEINPLAQKKIAEIIERDINNPDIEVQAVNGKFILKGVANSAAEKAKAEIIAKTYVPPPVINQAEKLGVVKKRKEIVVINLLQIRTGPPPPPSKTIQLVVHYVELKKDYLRSSAFRWEPALQDETSFEFTKDTRGQNDGVLATIGGVISGLIPKLNWAKKHGFARILKSATVTTQDGKLGVLKSQVEIPYLERQPNNQGNSVRFRPVGVESKITPRIVNPRSDMIELGMKFSVSSIIGKSNDNPQVSNNELESTINVRSGQSAAVGGLISNDAVTTYNPDPNTEVIISLVAGKDFTRNRNQFVIFVTPIIKSSASAGSEKVKRKFRLRDQ